MSRTIYYTATTLDGFLADPHDSLDWLFEVPAEPPTERFNAFFAGIGAFLMGSATYEWILDHEKVLESPEKWTAWYGETPAVVMTTRELPAVPGVRFASGDVRPVHAALVEAAGPKDIWVVGGGELAGQLADHGLLDELLVSVAPVTLGAGKPLLPRVLTSKDLTLTKVEPDGQFVHLTYLVRLRQPSPPLA
jgi:dihydrofolate reductase